MDIATTATIGVLAALWSQIRDFVLRVRSLFCTRAMIDGNASADVHAYISKHFRRTPFGDRLFRSTNQHVRPLNCVATVAYEAPPKQPLIFWRNWFTPILVGGIDGGPQASSSYIVAGTINLTVPRWLNVERLVIDSLQWARSHKRNSGTRYMIRHITGSAELARAGNGPYGAPVMATPEISGIERWLGWSDSDIGEPQNIGALAVMSITPAIQNAVEQFEHWKENRDWFQSRSIPWRRGWLLHGKPGSGKTSLVRALAQKHDMPIYTFDLATLSNREFHREWRDMQTNTPCIALLEDIDAIFNLRESLVSAGDAHQPLTFDCLLNNLGGVESANGVFVMVTTNNLEAIDPALRRAGRLDDCIEVPPLDEAGHRKIVGRILSDYPHLHDGIMREWENLTAAQMTERCVAAALREFWRKDACNPNIVEHPFTPFEAVNNSDTGATMNSTSRHAIFQLLPLPPLADR